MHKQIKIQPKFKLFNYHNVQGAPKRSIQV